MKNLRLPSATENERDNNAFSLTLFLILLKKGDVDEDSSDSECNVNHKVTARALPDFK